MLMLNGSEWYTDLEIESVIKSVSLTDALQHLLIVLWHSQNITKISWHLDKLIPIDIIQ